MSGRYFFSAFGLVNALGDDLEKIAPALFAGDTRGMLAEPGWLPGRTAMIGKVASVPPAVLSLAHGHNSRNNRLLLMAVAQIQREIDAALACFGAHRIGIVLGTSTSGFAEGEAAMEARLHTGEVPADYFYSQQEIGIPAVFLASHLGLSGPAYTVSTACTSSAKTFISARNLLKHGICDAVIVGGVDSLCKLTLNGFAALESLSDTLCNPMSANRRGINIGEAAAVFLMVREPGGIEFLGAGETSDAHHMTAPDPEGHGAESAMRLALQDAGLNAEDVDYLNLHATATPKNDEMESLAVSRVFPHGVAASGTKPLVGHTLGAAGATELGFCCLALQHGRMPPHRWDGQPDAALPSLELLTESPAFPSGKRRVCMSNSFAFGGSNVSLIIGDATC